MSDLWSKAQAAVEELADAEQRYRNALHMLLSAAEKRAADGDEYWAMVAQGARITAGIDHSVCPRIGGEVTLQDGVCPECGWRWP